MFAISIIIRALACFFLVIHSLNFLADPTAWNFCKFALFFPLALHFIFNFYNKDESDGSTFAYMPLYAAYKKDGDYGSVSKYVWLTKVNYRYHDGVRKYYTDSLFSK